MKFLTSDRIYAHIDCNSFFVSCEQFRNPSLIGKKVCVWWEIIVAASYEAKKLWIKTWTPIWEARQILWNKWIFINADLDFYRSISKRFINFLQDYSNLQEVFSIDESFVDITWIPEIYGLNYHWFAVFLKKLILKNLWIPVSIWVANTRIKAKIFSDINKPFWEFIAFEDTEIIDIFSKLKVSEVPFIWKKTSEKLNYICKTIEDFRRLSFWKVNEILGKNWTDLWLELNGVDIMNFKWNSIPLSITRTSSFNKKITNDKLFIWQQIITHFDRAYLILNKYNIELGEVAIYLRDRNFVRYYHSFKFEERTNIRSSILSKINDIFKKEIDFEKFYRSTWIYFWNFREYKPKQLSLIDNENNIFTKNKNLSESIEKINRHFGKKLVSIGDIRRNYQ